MTKEKKEWEQINNWFFAIEKSGFKDYSLLVAGGRRPSETFLWQTAKKSSDIYAIDKGWDYCMQAEIAPTMILGDGDSSKYWQKAKKSGIKIQEYKKDKNDTDLQLALKYCLNSPYPKNEQLIILTGVFGGRLDHLWSNVLSVHSLKKKTRHFLHHGR